MKKTISHAIPKNALSKKMRLLGKVKGENLKEVEPSI
jgi:hypothetical protein